VLFTGVNTDQCVLCSLQDANFLGYGFVTRSGHILDALRGADE